MKLVLFLCIVVLGLAAEQLSEKQFPVDRNDPYVRSLLDSLLNQETPPQQVITVQNIVGLIDPYFLKESGGFAYKVDYIAASGGKQFQCHILILDPPGPRSWVLQQSCFPYEP